MARMQNIPRQRERTWDEVSDLGKIYVSSEVILYSIEDIVNIIASQLWEAQANPEAAFYIDGHPCVRASYRRIAAYLPFLTVHMVRTAVRKLLREGVIKVGEYNGSRLDRTHSYAFTGYGIDLMRS